MPPAASPKSAPTLAPVEAPPASPVLFQQRLEALFEASPDAAFWVLELCAGSAALCATFRDLGAGAIPVDHQRNRFKQHMPCLVLDLTIEDDVASASALVKDPRIKLVHMGVPCGTMNKARERPIDPAKLARGCPAPSKLRSRSHPRGLPQCLGLPQVVTGNQIADLCGEIARWCCLNGKLFTVENPLGSYLWKFRGLPGLHAW